MGLKDSSALKQCIFLMAFIEILTLLEKQNEALYIWAILNQGITARIFFFFYKERISLIKTLNCPVSPVVLAFLSELTAVNLAPIWKVFFFCF